jgi:hypothetical protein
MFVCCVFFRSTARAEFLVTIATMGTAKSKESESGKLRIGDDWNAIRIIALSQSNPLKAIAEFVENSIDAHAKTIAITRGREHGGHYLTVKDDGDGVPRDPNGVPDFQVRRDSYLRLDQATPEGRWRWGFARRIWHRSVELLDRGRYASDDF